MRGRALGAFALAVACAGAVSLQGCKRRSTEAHGVEAPAKARGQTWAEIDLSAGAPEVRAAGLLKSEHDSFIDLVAAIERVRDDDEHAGVLVRFGATRMGWARAVEVGRALASVREAKRPVWCHADELGNASYMVAAKGCDRIWLSPAGALDTVGIAVELLFARDLLGKLGVEADIFQVGKYKGTGETFTRSQASDEVKASLGGMLSDLRAIWLESIEIGRHRVTVRDRLEDGPHAPTEAKAAGLIDEVGYARDVVDAARSEGGAGRFEVVFGAKAGHGGGPGLPDLVRTLAGTKRRGGGGRGHVALLRAVGAITVEPSGSALPGGRDGIVARTMIKQIRQLAEDRSAKAVVLRIDSPGGSALASDLLWKELIELRKKKPLVVSVGDMAASGGYYMACAGTRIIAEESSIVGSVGVVGGKIAIGPGLKQFGVNHEVVGATPEGSARAAYESSLTRWDDATKARVQATMRSVYDLFLDRVAEGRGVPREKVETFAEGRVFTGREGRALGMVDDWGGLVAAVDLARGLGGLPPDARVRVVGASKGLLDVLDGDDDDAEAMLRARLVPSFGLPDEAVAFAHAQAPLLSGERTLVAVPFALLVR